VEVDKGTKGWREQGVEGARVIVVLVTAEW
jgi:hypothetical protein